MTPRLDRYCRRASLILAATAFLAIGCGSEPEGRADAAAENERVTPVRVAPVERVALFQSSLRVTGSVMALKNVQLFSKVPGRLEKLLVDEGQRVTKGQALAVIERRTVEAQVQAAKAGMGVAKAQAAAAEAGLQSATTEVKRLRTLYKKGSVTQQQLDGAETGYRAALAQRDLAKAQIDQFAAQLEAVAIQLDECTIRSPMSGMIVEDYDRTVGEMIAPQLPVLHVADMTKVRVVARISEEMLASVTAGSDAYVEVARYAGRTFRGKVVSLSPTIDIRSRTAKAEILIDNPIEEGSYALKPGMFAQARIVTASQAGALAISDHALKTVDGEQVVFVVKGDRAQKRVVTAGLTDGDRVVIVDGLTEGETVVVEGAAGLPDGARVKTEGASRE